MRKKRKPQPIESSWMVTFADMMTLLLTFFVLLLAMSTLDYTIIRDVSTHFLGDVDTAKAKGAGQLSTHYQMVEELLQSPKEALLRTHRLKDLLFPDTTLPKDMARGQLKENLEILARPEGVALVLSDKLLFDSGQSVLKDDGRKVLAEFAKFLATVTMPINVAGYTDNVPGRARDNYSLSADRAMSVLSYFLEFGFDPMRFSVSGYGEKFPLGDNETPEGRAKNRRVEILLKTSGRTFS